MKTSIFSEQLSGAQPVQNAQTSFSFTPSALPVIGRCPGARCAAGVALAYATDEAESCGEDRFSLLLVDGEGDVLQRLGVFHEDEVVAVWRDLAAQAGLVRMIVREDGMLTPVSQQIGRLVLGRTRTRRRHAGLGQRRPRFLARRKTGRLPARPLIFRGEHEIIARS
ncbi:DUF6101 family protein [Methylobacterium sp. NEAU 140]|uniref:DUF6101 family protein n=1 Tax=Methylobacterium sp. NEAU 140 TaxID=3064945 RepID=UPI002736FD3A|nr:DUF6101 family protein [Methylobacterium sp. NEAU 140]MDP4021230.1 DUF6101 family protein [Methylobacterium sp. NEAU 140]